jgi:GntR family transcriptional regulator
VKVDQVIQFHLERSGVPTYLQIVQQVKQAIRLGVLRPGDQLPTVKEVVSSLTINPNTVLHAYRQLDMEGLVEGRRGVGTFVAENPQLVPPDGVDALRAKLGRWVASARGLGLDDEAMAGLFGEAVRGSSSTDESRVA